MVFEKYNSEKIRQARKLESRKEEKKEPGKTLRYKERKQKEKIKRRNNF
jgi:hypothetical protein